MVSLIGKVALQVSVIGRTTEYTGRVVSGSDESYTTQREDSLTSIWMRKKTP